LPFPNKVPKRDAVAGNAAIAAAAMADMAIPVVTTRVMPAIAIRARRPR